MQNRWEAWYLALKAAKMIVAECQKNIAAPLSDNQWWTVLRFREVGEQIKRFFDSNPKEKDLLHKMFLRNNSRLSYYEFGRFLTKTNIKLVSWEKEALYDRLDRLCLAFIEFSEFNEFTSAYGVDWGVHI